MSTTYACGPYKGGDRDRQREFRILAKAFAFCGTTDALGCCMPERRSTEYYGQGQSGYTAGRNEGDPALGIEGRNIGFPKGTDEEHVLEVVRTGYSLNGRLLRPASVVVSSGPQKEGKN